MPLLGRGHDKYLGQVPRNGLIGMWPPGKGSCCSSDRARRADFQDGPSEWWLFAFVPDTNQRLTARYSAMFLGIQICPG